MEFVNSGLLWFAAAGSIPIIIHLLNRQKFRRLRWAAMEFLLAAVRKTQRRLKIENLILLLVRVALMILLALAIARPFLTEPSLSASSEGSTLALFVIDNSYSMGYKSGQKSSLDRAKEGAGELLKATTIDNEDRVAVLLLSDAPELLLHPTNKKNLAQDVLGEIRLSGFGTSFAATIPLIGNVLKKSQNLSKKVYLFTDMQRNGWAAEPEELRRVNTTLKELCKQAEFSLIDVGAEKPENGAVVDLRIREKAVVARKTTRFIAEIRNYSTVDILGRSVSLFVNGERRETVSAAVPAGSSATVPFDHEFLDEGAYEVRAELDADELETDDRRYLAVEVKEAIRILCVDGQPSEGDAIGETDFFLMALDPSQKGVTFTIDKTVAGLFTAEDLDRYDLIVLANVQYLSPEKIEKLGNFVRGGCGLFVTLGDVVDKGNYNDQWFKGGKGLLPAALEGIGGDDRKENPIRLIDVRYNHPALAYFREHDLKAALSSLLFYEFYKTTVDENDEKVRVLARFDDDDSSPAILERSFGEGKVILMTTTLDMNWNVMAGRPPFVVLMNEVAFHLSSRPLLGKNITIGDVIHVVLPMSRHAERFNLSLPAPHGEGGGAFVSLSPALIPGENKFSLSYPSVKRRAEEETPDKREATEGVREAGIYALSRVAPGEGEQVVSLFAANVSPDEGNLERATAEDIRMLYPDFRFQMAGGAEEKNGAAPVKTPPSNLWRYLLFAVLALLLVESTLAWLFGRSKA